MCERGQRGVTAPSANGAAAPRCLPAPRRVVSLRSITCVPHSSLRAYGVAGAEPAPMAPRQLRAHVPARSASLPSSVPRGQAGRASSRQGLLIRAGVCQRSAPLPVLVLVLAQRHRSCCAPWQGLEAAASAACCAATAGAEQHCHEPRRSWKISAAGHHPAAPRAGRMWPCHAAGLPEAPVDAPAPSPAPGSRREGRGSRLSWRGHQPPWGPAGTRAKQEEQGASFSIPVGPGAAPRGWGSREPPLTALIWSQPRRTCAAAGKTDRPPARAEQVHI